MAYLVLDRVKLLHRESPHDAHGHAKHQAMLGGGTFSAHSFLDGVAIGIAFQASVTVGAIVTIAVLTHDFSDGINTVNVVLKNGGSRDLARRWLLMDAVAPALGVLSTLFFTIPAQRLSLALAVFAGFFLYIGASDLIPESHHAHPKAFTTVMTLFGALVIYLSVLWAGG
jgi:ZIP family zinc transporter